VNKKLALSLILSAVIIALYTLRLDQYITLEYINAHRILIQEWIALHPWLAPFLFSLAYVVTVTCAIPTGGVLTVAAGYFFGVPITTLAVVTGATVGASISFLLARYVLRDFIEQRYADRVKHLNKELDHYGLNYLLMVRLIPFMPFFLINPLVGLTRVSLFTFMWTTAVGIAPGTALYAFAGQELSNVSSMSEIFFSWQAAVALVVLASLAAIPLIVRLLTKKPLSL
jgi:uncharacterized membrane protein YdjX (TVP38/TMEM64 family)